MSDKGRRLEELVAHVERCLVPEGFVVTMNEKVYGDDGCQLAEFDIEVRGRFGSTEVSWLIECRDRPSSGPAPAAWIEQLIGRRTRFSFNKVTAVSTTGFSKGALVAADEAGIEVREVRAIDPDQFSWLAIRHMTIENNVYGLEHSEIFVADQDKPALSEHLESTDPSDFRLTSASSKTEVDVGAVFAHQAVESNLYDELADGEVRRVGFDVSFPDDEDHWVVVTKRGSIRVERLHMFGSLTKRQSIVRLAEASDYRKAGGDERFLEIATFAPFDALGKSLAVEFRKIAATGETHMLARVLGDAIAPNSGEPK